MDNERLLRHEQVKLLYEAMPLTAIATVINALILVVIEWNVVEPVVSIVWCASILIVTFLRLRLSYAYRQQGPEPDQATPWETYFSIGTIVAGIIWGSTALFLFPENSISHQVFLAFVVGGMCAGAITSLTPLPLPIFSFLILSLSPLCLRFFMNGSAMAKAMGVMLCLFLIMVAVSAFRIYRNTRQNIELRLQSRRQENIILQSKLEQRAIIDHAPMGIWLAGTDGRYRFVNRTLCDAIGIPESEFLSSAHPAELLGEEAATHCRKSDHECLEKEGPCISHEMLTFADGKQHMMEVTKVKVRDKAGQITGIVGIAVDITERQLAENELRKLSQAVEQTGESVVITDRQGTIEYVNPSFAKITGYQPEEVLGRNPRVLKSGKQNAEFYEHLWSAITKGENWHGTVIDRRKDGSQYPALLSISPILDSHGEITHYVGIQQDMTHIEMLEEKFRQAQKMEALGTLVGGIAHEFNNMLTGMTGNLYLARKKAADFPDVLKKMDDVEELNFRAAAMIKQLLAFARKGSIEMKPLGLISLTKSASDIIRASIPENISFRSEFCQDELIVKGDGTQLQQVLMNLTNNARDALAGVSEPVISLKIGTFEADDPFSNKYPGLHGRKFAQLTVSDNGSGISEADIGHIFEPFHTTKAVGHGTGLGLSMVYGAIRAHQGVIEVESEVGKCTAFHIYLPLVEEKIVEIPPDELTAAVPGNGELILMVDDNVDIRNAGREVLNSIGYQVLEAADGLQAVEQFAANRHAIDLIIMDVVMPQLGGIQAAERIRALCRNTKVIFATGYDKGETLNSEMPSDDHVVLSKPYNIVKLSQAIRAQLDS